MNGVDLLDLVYLVVRLEDICLAGGEVRSWLVRKDESIIALLHFVFTFSRVVPPLRKLQLGFSQHVRVG